jgi:hypothetical protein
MRLIVKWWKQPFNFNNATFDLEDYFLFFGVKGVVYSMGMEYQVVEMIVWKDVIVVYFVSLKFFCIGWHFESMLPPLSRDGWLLVVRIDTIQFGDRMLWLGSNGHTTLEINHISIENRKLMCAKVVFLSIKGFKVILSMS